MRPCTIPIVFLTWPSSLPIFRFHFLRYCSTRPYYDGTGESEEEFELYASLLQRYARTGNLCSGNAVHCALRKQPFLFSSLFLQNHLLNAYFKCRDTFSARRLFDEMPLRNVVSWSSAIAGFVHCGRPDLAFSHFQTMRAVGPWPNEFTFVSLLNACAVVGCSHAAYQIYALVVKLGFASNAFLTNAFLTCMIRVGYLAGAVQLFEDSWHRDAVTWNSMLAGFLQLSYSEVWRFWHRMVGEGIKLDEFAFSTVLTGVAETASLGSGRQVHAQLVKCGHGNDLCVGDSLVDMYLKNRVLLDGLRAFEDMPSKDVVSWTQIASGCLQNGQPDKALQFFRAMMQMGIMPNRFTMATAFGVCASLVSVEEGRKAHGLRVKLGDSVDPCVDNAMIDMYAKCGCTNEAWRVFLSIKEKSVVSWTTMIMCFAQNGLAADALRTFEWMISAKVCPNGVTYVCVLYACSQGGFIDEGWQHFTSMTRNHNILPEEDHYACMVDLLGRRGKVMEARALIESMPFLPGPLVWQTLLNACRLYGNVEMGKEAAEKALIQDGTDHSTYILLHNMFASSSSWDGAKMVRTLIKDRGIDRTPGRSWIEATN